MGNPGWVLLTHNEDKKPIALFNETPIPLVMDERLFSDTVLRVVKIGKDQYVVYDIDYLNGKSVFDIWNYQTRSQKIKDILEVFHSPDLSALISVDDVPHGTIVRGYEHYDDQPGSMGVFLPVNT